MSLPVWQELYESIGPDRFELISVAQDSGDPTAVGKWFDRGFADVPVRRRPDTPRQLAVRLGERAVGGVDRRGRAHRSQQRRRVPG